MNPDIRVQTTFPHHHKTKKLRRKLGDSGIVALLFLWVFAAENRPDGVLSGMDPDDIAVVCQWDGDATSMLQALLDVGFLELVEGVYVLHDWIENNPWAAAAPARKAKASAAARVRWEKRNDVDGGNAPSIPADARSIENGASSNAPSPTPKPSPSPSPIPVKAAGGPPSRTEVMLRECVTEKSDFLTEHFPALDLVLETEELVAKYGSQSIGADPWLIVLRWFRKSKEVADGKCGPRNPGGPGAPAAGAEESGSGSLTDEFCSRTPADPV